MAGVVKPRLVQPSEQRDRYFRYGTLLSEAAECGDPLERLLAVARLLLVLQSDISRGSQGAGCGFRARGGAWGGASRCWDPLERLLPVLQGWAAPGQPGWVRVLMRAGVRVGGHPRACE